MSLKYIISAIAALGFGLLSSGGVFTVFVSVGLVPRFADKTHTANKILLYENCIVAGTVTGCLLSVYPDFFQKVFVLWLGRLLAPWDFWANVLLSVFGVFGGMFVGCFAIAIAEMLNAIPIFTRRIRLGRGAGVVILLLALGKTVGALAYFFFGFGK